MAGRKPTPQRAELYRLRDYDRKVRQIKRASARANKLRAVVQFGGKS